MYSFEHAESYASDGLWAWFSARSELSAAISAVDCARTALMTLVDDSAWQSDGVRALHDLLGRLHDRARTVGAALEARAGEIEAVGRV